MFNICRHNPKGRVLKAKAMEISVFQDFLLKVEIAKQSRTNLKAMKEMDSFPQEKRLLEFLIFSKEFLIF